MLAGFFSFLGNWIVPTGVWIFRAKELYPELKDTRERTTTEKVDYVVQTLALLTSLGDLGCQYHMVRWAKGAQNLTERAKKINLGMRIASASANFASAGTSIAVKLEKSIASKEDLIRLLAVGISESSRSVGKANKLYETFAADCIAKAPFLFPKGLVQQLRAEGVALSEVQKAMQRLFEKYSSEVTFYAQMIEKSGPTLYRWGTGQSLRGTSDNSSSASAAAAAAAASPTSGQVAANLQRVAGMDSSHRLQQTRLPNGTIVHHFARSQDEEEEEEQEEQTDSAKKRELIENAAKIGIQCFSFETILRRNFERNPELQKFICPITRAPILEPVYVRKFQRLFEKTALQQRLQEHPEAYSLFLDAESVTIYPHDAQEERKEDVKALQAAREKALKDLIRLLRHEASFSENTVDTIDLDKEARECSITPAELERLIHLEMERNPKSRRFICPLTKLPIKKPVFVPSLECLFEKGALEETLVRGAHQFTYLGEERTIPKNEPQERKEDLLALNQAYRSALSTVTARMKRTARFSSSSSSLSE